MTSKFVPRFTFCGEIVVPNKKELVTRETITFGNSSAEKLTLNLGIKHDMNCVYVNCQDFKNKVIKTTDVNKNTIEIDWEDRFDESIIATVAPFRKYVVDLGERKEFITKWDFIEHLGNALAGYSERIFVTGNYSISPYKGKFYENYEINGVYAVKEEDKPHFKLLIPLYYDKDSLDRSEEKKTGRLYLSAYTPIWSKSDKEDRMMPFAAVLNTSVYDVNNPTHMEIKDYKIEILEPKQRGWASALWECAIINGSEEIKFDESCLTKAQKRQVELGISTVDEFKPKGSIYGTKIVEHRLIKPIADKFWADGPMIENVYSQKDFEPLIYSFETDESVESMMKSASSSKDEDISPIDLF